MRSETSITDDTAREVLSELLSVNHGWWFDFIEEYSDKDGVPKQRLANRPHFSETFLQMYGYSAAEMNPKKIFLHRKTLKTVVRDFREVMRPGSKARSARRVAHTKSGERKLIEEYVRRIDRPDGTAILASLHSDLTISSEVQWIEHNVLDKLQAFVFVKKWDPTRNQFVFTYMNDKLIEVLEPDPKKLVEGSLSDDDFFEDWAQKRAFREDDEAIRDAENADLVMMREETFNPVQKSADNNGNQPVIPSRLLTFKTPLSIPSRGSREIGWEVLGIAIDVTSVTDVLRSISEISESGLYIKDDKRRYHYVNDRFLELLNATNERQILDRTFVEALRELSEVRTGPQKVEIDRLAQLVEIEDNEIFSGEVKKSEIIRALSLPMATDWLTIKQPIESQNRGVTHLLGMTSPMFPGLLGAASSMFPDRLSEILDKFPQCISVKRYCPAEQDQPGEFRLIWANRSFLDIHGAKGRADVIGKSDTDLWPGDPEQVDEFRRRDRFVVKTYQKLRTDPAWNKLSLSERWSRVVRELRDQDECKCWEFRETTRSRTKTRVLQTTKWAEEIGGTLFVVVVYSDVTKGDAEQEHYHRLTTHTLKGAIGPISNARSHLEQIQAASTDPCDDVRAAIACLDDVSHSFDLFLQFHLKLLRMDVKCRLTDLDELLVGIKAEAEKLQRSWRVTVKVENWCEGAAVWCDPALMQFVIAELLLNSVKATSSRSNVEAADNMPYTPNVALRFETTNGEVFCTISDNGWSCSNPDSRTELLRSFASAQADPYNRDSRTFGLPFCVVAVRAQGCQLVLASTNDDSTEFIIRLPISSQGVIS